MEVEQENQNHQKKQKIQELMSKMYASFFIKNF